MNRIRTVICCLILSLLFSAVSVANESEKMGEIELKEFDNTKSKETASVADEGITLKEFEDVGRGERESGAVRVVGVYDVKPVKKLRAPKNRFAVDVAYTHRTGNVYNGGTPHIRDYASEMRNGISYAASYHRFFTPYLGIGGFYNGRHYFRSHHGEKNRINAHLIAPSFISRQIFRSQDILYATFAFGYVHYKEKFSGYWDEHNYDHSYSKSGVGGAFDIGYDFSLSDAHYLYLGLFVRAYFSWVDIRTYDRFSENFSAIDIGVGFRF